ncbi:hypothetical protein JHK85_027678 [Glycine max]|nr:hypothetical protein JHK85_027678 [Glycine max]
MWREGRKAGWVFGLELELDLGIIRHHVGSFVARMRHQGQCGLGDEESGNKDEATTTLVEVRKRKSGKAKTRLYTVQFTGCFSFASIT